MTYGQFVLRNNASVTNKTVSAVWNRNGSSMVYHVWGVGTAWEPEEEQKKHLEVLVLCFAAVIGIVGYVDPVFLACGMQLFLESLNLPRQLLDVGGLGHLAVDFGAVADVFGTVCIVERGQRLFCAVHSRRNGRDDAGLGLAAQRVTEQASELGIAVGDMARALHQGRDDTAESEQALVDQPGLDLGMVVGDIWRWCHPWLICVLRGMHCCH